MYLKKVEEALKLIKKQIYLLPIAILLEVLFLLSYGFLHSFIERKIAPFVQNILLVSSQLSADIDAFSGSESAVTVLMGNPVFSSNISSILQIMFAMVLAVYILWIIFHGSNWFLANKFANRKIKFMQYINRFSLINLFWFVILIIIIFGSAVYAFNHALSPEPAINETIFSWIGMIIYAIIFYFAFISIALIDKSDNIKKTFKIGINKFHKVIPAYLIIVLVLFIFNHLVSLVMKINYSLSVFLAIIVVLPFLTLFRVYFLLIIEKIKN